MTFSKMKFRFLLVLINILIGAISLYSQNLQQKNSSALLKPQLCGFDEIMREKMKNPLFEKAQKKLDSILSYNQTKSNTKYEIPCVVHVCYRSNSCPGYGILGNNSGNISSQQVIEGIKKLNQDLRAYNGYGPDLEIEFVLAAIDENGNCTNGINYVDMSSNSDFANNGIATSSTYNGMLYSDLASQVEWDPTKYYNIYLSPEVNSLLGTADCHCQLGDWATSGRGWALSGTASGDGAYMLTCSFLASSRDRIFTHEIGHSLGLYHTFEGDGWGSYCPDNTNCLTDGDQCCDTPPHIMYNGGSAASTVLNCEAGSNSCSNEPDSKWAYNYMSYGGVNCRREFTNDQKTRARNAVENTLDDLLASNGNTSLNPPSNVNIEFSSSETSVDVTECIEFNNITCGLPNSGIENQSDLNNISYLWTIDDPNDWLLPMKSKRRNPTFCFYNAGTYDVKLEVTINGTIHTENKTDHISVSGYSSISTNGWANSSNSVSSPTFGQSNPVFDCNLNVGKVWFKIDQIEKLDNCDASSSYLGTSDGDLEYINKVSALRYMSSGNSMSWKYTGNYGPYDESSNYFTINPNHVFFHETLSSGDYPLYRVSEASWEDDDGIEDIWATCSSFLGIPSPCDDCIDTWKNTGWKWIDKVSGKYNFPGNWFLLTHSKEMIGN